MGVIGVIGSSQSASDDISFSYDETDDADEHDDAGDMSHEADDRGALLGVDGGASDDGAGVGWASWRRRPLR